MNNNRRYFTLLLVLILLIIQHTANAQMFATYREYPKPSVILVKLPTYNKRFAIYENAKNYKYAKQIKEDAANMQRELIRDFNANFNFCEYYFFYDTVQDAVNNGQLAGNLYDKDMKPVTTSPIKEGDTTYQIAYYGSYVTEFGNPDNPKKGKENTYYAGTQSDRLVLLNYQQNRIPDPVPNGTNYDDRYLQFRNMRKWWYTTYKSKLFDISYTPYAQILSQHMNNYYNRKNVK